MQTVALEKLINRKTQLEAKIKLIEARNKENNRKEDTRRKILAGAFVLHKHEQEGLMEKLIQELDAFLFKPADRALFGLEPRGD
jgi:hypothetical protein